MRPAALRFWRCACADASGGIQRNLAKNGGVLDGVIFLERTKDEADLKFLDKLIKSEPDYESWKIDMGEEGFASAYEGIEDDVMYVKMDDDIVSAKSLFAKFRRGAHTHAVGIH